MPVESHWRIEAPRNHFSLSTFRLKLGNKPARGLGLGRRAAAIDGHSQERRDLFVFGHAADLRWAGGVRTGRRVGSRSKARGRLLSDARLRKIAGGHSKIVGAI